MLLTQNSYGVNVGITDPITQPMFEQYVLEMSVKIVTAVVSVVLLI
jgi:hypothetical protein